MQRVHRELKSLSGEKNPLVIVADRIADEARVICFDEFFVSDITDAMILAGLFDRPLCARRGSCCDVKYCSRWFVQRWFAAGAVLTRHCLDKDRVDVVNVDGGVDYRLRALEQAELIITH